MVRRGPVLRSLALALALGCACNDHRYGYFGDGEGGATGFDSGDDGDAQPTTASSVTIATLDPSGADPGDPDPSSPGPLTTPDPTGSSGLCGEEQLVSGVSQRFDRDSTDGPSPFALSCGPWVRAQAVFTWAPPFDGVFRFDTAGSSFDTVLAVLGGHCEGSELGCSDDELGAFSSVSTKLSAGQTVTIVIGGANGESGPLVLNINEEEELSSCSFVDLGDQMGPFGSSTELGSERWRGSCGGDGANEMIFRWQAPFAGAFRFETVGSSFDPILYARLGDCEGDQLFCVDDGATLEPIFDVFLTPADGPVMLFVDGRAPGVGGEFTLQISPL